MTEGKDKVARGPRFPSSKFSVPTAGPRLVHRSRLFDELERGQRARLTLVVGSPGAGKTALLADWVASAPRRPFAWLSCDVADADPVRFVAAIIEALRRATGQAGIGEDARQLLSLDGEVSADALAALADDLEGAEGVGALVVDDFHLTGTAGADALALLVEYRPASLQLVVASRVDPQLRLHRMRANQELVELRDRDLSFSPKRSRPSVRFWGTPERTGPGCGPPPQRGLGGGLADGRHLDPGLARPRARQFALLQSHRSIGRVVGLPIPSAELGGPRRRPG